MKPFLVSIYALRLSGVSVRECGVLGLITFGLDSVSIEHEAIRFAQEKWPPADGWTQHGTVTTPLTKDLAERIHQAFEDEESSEQGGYVM